MSFLRNIVSVKDKKEGGATTALHIAVKNKNLEKTKFLLANGCKPDERDEYGATPLQYAAFNGSINIVKELCAYGASKNVSLPFSGNTYRKMTLLPSPFLLALFAWNRNRSRAWGESKEDHRHFYQLAFLLLPKKLDKIDGYFAIVYATIIGCHDLMKALLAMGVNPNPPAEMSLQEITFEFVIGYGLIENSMFIDYKGMTPLHYAVRRSVELTKTLIEAKANLHAENDDQLNPLHIAAKSGNYDIIPLLIEQKVNQEIKVYKGSKHGLENKQIMKVVPSPFMQAFIGFNKKIISDRNSGVKDLAKKQYPNYLQTIHALISNRLTPTEGYFGLIYASKLQLLSVVDALLAQGVSPNAFPYYNLENFYFSYEHESIIHNGTPLHMAAQENNIEIVYRLLKAKAKINANSSDGYTPLCIAAREGHLTMVKYLVENGASITSEIEMKTQKLEQSGSPFTLLLSAGYHRLKKLDEAGYVEPQLPDFDEKEREEYHSLAKLLMPETLQPREAYCALIFAVTLKFVDIVKILLEKGAPINLPRQVVGKEETPLHAAVSANHLTLVKLLLKHQADVNARDEEKQTPLHLVKSAKIAKALLQCKDINVNAKDKNLNTPLHNSTDNENIEVTKLLLKHKAKISLNKNHQSPIHRAACKHNSKILQLLFKSAEKKGQDIALLINQPDLNEYTSLHFVPFYLGTGEEERAQVTQLLLDRRALVNAVDRGKCSALHRAAAGGQDQVVKVLLDNKANPNITDIEGATPLQFAISRCSNATINLFLGCGADSKLIDTNKLSAKKTENFETLKSLRLDTQTAAVSISEEELKPVQSNIKLKK